MNQTLTADDLWPLVLKLTHGEQVRLAKLGLAWSGQRHQELGRSRS